MPYAPVDELADAIAAALEEDEDGYLSAIERMEVHQAGALALLRYATSAVLWDYAGGRHATSEEQSAVSAALSAEGSPWEGVFDAGVLETVLDVFSGGPVRGRRIPPDQEVPALFAITAYLLPPQAVSSRWADWHSHYESIVSDFRKHYPAYARSEDA